MKPQPLKVLALTRYGRLGPSSRLRCYQFLPTLSPFGIDVTISPLIGDAWLARRLAGTRTSVGMVARSYMNRVRAIVTDTGYDLLWIEKESFPWLPSLIERLPNLRGTPYVVDYDDATFHTYDRHRSWIVRRALGGKIAALMRSAAGVTVANPYLQQYALRSGAVNVVRLPTVVDVRRYGLARRTDASGLRIGWIGTPSTAPYLEAIAEPLRLAMRNYSATLVTVGVPTFTLDGMRMERHAWSEATEVRHIQSFDIGIMPLPDDPWTRGKSGYKLIQYMACGLPTIASPVGVNATMVEQERTGFLAAEPNDWVHAFDALAGDIGLRHRLGDNGRTKVESEYSLDLISPKLAAALLGAANRGQLDAQ